MILITRSDETNKVYTTLDGRDFVKSLFVRNDATRVEAVIPTGDDTSLTPGRYNLFLVPSSAFEDLPDGYYRYEIKEVETGLIIETGKLYITPNPTAEIPSANTPDDDVVIIN